MNSLNFDEGYKELAINGDENRIIKINPLDVSMFNRYDEVKNEIDEAIEMSKDFENKEKAEKIIREKIEYILNSKCCDVVFGCQSIFAPCSGQFLFMNFLNSVLDYSKTEYDKLNSKSEEKIKKYTDKVKK